MNEYEDLREELILSIQAAAFSAPRNGQIKAGPSEIGGCARKLAYKLAGTPKLHDDISWRPTVGTAIHEWLAGRFVNILLPDSTPRYLVEHPVRILHGDHEIRGTADLYDKATHTVIDWKCLSPTGMKGVKTKGVGHSYDWQRHLYGYGMAQSGLRVEHVAVMALPKTGDWNDMVLLAEPYSQVKALEALERYVNVQALVGALGDQAPLYTPTTDVDPGLCSWCPWVNRSSTELATGCPGVPRERAKPAITVS